MEKKKLLKYSIAFGIVKKIALLMFFISSSETLAQGNPESLNNELAKLEAKVALSKNYLKISAYTTLTALTTTLIFQDIFSLGTTIAGIFTTPYHLIRHLKFVKKLKAHKKENGGKT